MLLKFGYLNIILICVFYVDNIKLLKIVCYKIVKTLKIYIVILFYEYSALRSNKTIDSVLTRLSIFTFF